MKEILIIGAKSDIAKSLTEVYASNHFNLILAARKINVLNRFAKELKQKYSVNIDLIELDVEEISSHHEFIDRVPQDLYGVIYCAGYLGDNKDSIENFEEAHRVIKVNYLGAVSLLNKLSLLLIKKREGFIVGISSVAGDRGRKSNFVYGSSKAAFSEYLSGLRGFLDEYNIRVLTVKPGFVLTKMTKDHKTPKSLTADTNYVAKKIFSSINKEEIYIYGIWRLIMIIIKLIPERLFKKINF